jgi:hypothetical protein
MTHARACRVLGSSKPPIDVLASDRRATEVRLTDQGWQAITDASEGPQKWTAVAG